MWKKYKKGDEVKINKECQYNHEIVTICECGTSIFLAMEDNKIYRYDYIDNPPFSLPDHLFTL